MINLKDYIKIENIFFLEGKNKYAILETMTEKLKNNPQISNYEEFHKGIINREKILSTGIGKNVAIPHVKIASISDFFISIAVLKNEVEWASFDKLPVKLVFMIGGPANHTIYLQILAKLTLLIKNDKLREGITSSKTEQDIFNILKEY